MSTSLKVTVWIIVIIVVVAGIWWWYSSAHQQNVAVNLPTQNVQNSQPSATTPVAGLATSPKDSSDAALNTDLSTIDNQMKDLNTDSASVNASLGQ